MKQTYLRTTDYAGLWRRIDPPYGIRIEGAPVYVQFRYPEWFSWISIAL
jgi:hypothetical protein